MKKEYIIAGTIGVAVLILNNLPVLVGFIGNREGMFLGRKPVNFADTYTYIADIEQARQGKVLFENLYTSEPQKPTLLRPSYLLAGLVARATGLPSLGAFHLFRVLFSIVFLMLSYRFLGVFFHEARSRMLGFLVLLTSAGLGFILSDIADQPIDLWVPEANTFFMLAEAPHFILSQILIIAAILGYLAYRPHRSVRYLLLSAGSLVLLSFEHPYSVIPLFLTVVGFHIWTKGSARALMIYALVASLGALPYVYQMRTNPNFIAWMSADISRSPGVASYLLGYGFLIVFALLGVNLHWQKTHTMETNLLFLWMGIIAVMIYLPYAAQRRFIEGFHIPLAIVATEGIMNVVGRMRLVPFVGFILAGLMMTTIVSRTVWDAQAIVGDTKKSYTFYLAPEEISAMRWLGAHTGSADVILSNFFYGNLIPGITGRKVFLGHPQNTARFEEKLISVNAFLLEKDPQSAQQFLKDNGITMLFALVPEGRPYLTRVYNQGGIEIFHVL